MTDKVKKAASKAARPVRIREVLHKCPFCNTKYKRESTLLTHKCDKRDRYNNRESRTFKEAFRMWMIFNTHYQIRLKAKVELEMQFALSRYFLEFHTFAEYVLDNNILDKEEFIKYIICSGMNVCLWRTHDTLHEWILKRTRDEKPTAGVERSITALVEWSTSTGYDWTTFFDYCSSHRVLMWFESGKLSPWILYAGSDSNREKILSRMSTSERNDLNKFITPVVWKPLQRLNIEEVNNLKRLLGEYGL